MNFFTKLICSCIVIAATAIGSIVTGLEWNDRRMEEKDKVVRKALEKKIKETKKELVATMDFRKALRDVEMKGMEDRLSTKINNTSDKVDDLKEDIQALYRMGKSIEKKVTLQNGDEVPYTITQKTKIQEGKEEL